MHGTLIYPLPGHPRMASSRRPSRGMSLIPKLPPNLRKRLAAAWKRILLAEFLRRSRTR
jgi:hypothetical protein